MSSNSYDAEQPGCSRRAVVALGIGFLCVGFIGMVLGGSNLLALLLSPTALQNDNSLGPYFLSLYSVPIFSLLVLISLFLLKVRWFLAIGALLLSLLAAYAYNQGWLFLPAPTVGAYNVLVYGGGVILLSLIIVVSVIVRGVHERFNRQRTDA